MHVKVRAMVQKSNYVARAARVRCRRAPLSLPGGTRRAATTSAAGAHTRVLVTATGSTPAPTNTLSPELLPAGGEVATGRRRRC